MAYATMSDMRIPYDIDGTQVGYRITQNIASSVTLTQGASSWLSTADKAKLNNYIAQTQWRGEWWQASVAFFFVFPEKRDLSAFWISYQLDTYKDYFIMQCSTDTTNGLDGSWSNVSVSVPSVSTLLAADSWRKDVISLTGVVGVTGIRLVTGEAPNAQNVGVTNIHLYGKKTAGQTPSDIMFTDAAGVEITSLEDFLTVGRGGSKKATVYLKNTSESTANSVTVDVEGAGYTTSLDNVTFSTSQKAIGNLAAGAISAPVYVKLAPAQDATLGPGDGRIITNLAYFG